MVIRLRSDHFEFEEARAWLLRQDWGRLPESVVVHQGRCVDNIVDIDVSEGAIYNLWLSEITLRGKTTGRKISVAVAVLPIRISITSDDLRAGHAVADVQGDSAFRITVRDGESIAAPNQSITFLGDFLSSTVCTDDNGSIIILDDPTRCHMTLPPHLTTQVERIKL